MMDVYMEDSSTGEPTEPVPFTGDVQAEITRLQSDPSLRDSHDFRRGEILDRLEDLYRRLDDLDKRLGNDPEAQDQPDQPEPLEMTPVGDAVDEAIDQLTKDWGEDLIQNVQTAQAAVADLSQSLGGSVEAFLDQSGLANDPTVIKVFHALGSGTDAPKLSKAEAQTLLTRLQSTPDYLRSSPLHEALVDVVADLTSIIHG